MLRQLLINLPVKDPGKAKIFYEDAGFLLNEELSDENAICYTIEENITIALLPAEHFKDAINQNEVADAQKVNEVLLSIGVDSNDEVDSLAARAIAAGGIEIGKPTDFGTIYGATFADIDGHQWNIFHMASPESET